MFCIVPDWSTLLDHLFMICIPPRRRKLFFFLFGAALMRESLYVNIGRCICLQWPNGTERVNTNKMAAAGMWIDLCKPIYHAFYFCVKRWHASWHSKLAYETVNVCDEFKSGFVCILPYTGRFVLDTVSWSSRLLQKLSVCVRNTDACD